MPKAVKGVTSGWGACSRTVSLGTNALALSYWNNVIAVGCEGYKIIILDAITGSQTAVLSSDTGSVAFSSDGRSLVSGTGNGTIELWDMQTGGVVKTFQRYSDQVQSVSISADCTKIASGFMELGIYLWDI